MAGWVDELRELLGDAVVSTDAAELAARSRDCWPALIMRERAGERLTPPAAVVWPRSTTQVAQLYRWASRSGVPVVPFGGGGGVTGAAAPVAGCLMVDTKRMDTIGPLDSTSGLVTVGPGVIGQNLEEWLGARGHTLGHFPSSVTISSVGGFAATRSAGQASTKYGKFEHMVAGLTGVLPDGTVVHRRPQPATAAGPDLGGVLLGSEGTLGLITELVLRVHPAPEAIVLRGYRLPSFAAGVEAIRTVLQRGLRPAVVRLYDEADTTLFHAEVGAGCLLVTACEGWPPLAELEDRALGEAVAAVGGDDLGEEQGRKWYDHRYDVSYKMADYLKPSGVFGDAVALDTMEIAAPWGLLLGAYDAVRAAMSTAMDVVLCHASHAYPDGACLYFTFGGAGAGDEAAIAQRYRAAWDAALHAAVDAGATITHHHGIGLLRAPLLGRELGEG
ncbi:MAG TPA: FAD-binding oxidoreductase, partial [Egibacteraceae bacterium]|nr:FAD-binding oxidoreductase [Egibacteraceae bacterium]